MAHVPAPVPVPVPAPVQIANIYAPPSDCPVNETDYRWAGGAKHTQKVWFNQGRWKVFPAAAPPATPPIVLFQRNARLVIDLAIPVDTNADHVLTAALPAGVMIPPTTRRLTAPGHTNIRSQVELTIPAPQVAGGVAKPLPWVFAGQLTVTLSRAPNTVIHTVQFDLAMYIVPDDLAKCYRDKGIPRALLTFPRLLPQWQTNNSADWGRFVVEALFNDNMGIQYENFHGSTKYTSWNVGNLSDLSRIRFYGVILDCWLDLWLSDQLGLIQRNDQRTKYPMNCYDIAAITQVLLFLGMPEEECRAVLMSPYGYLNPTRLIGCKQLDAAKALANGHMCNNPFYGLGAYDPEMLCNQNSLKRSKFSNHMFLIRDDGGNQGPRVLDACSGPQTGNVTLVDYQTTAIDTTTTLYANAATVYKATSAPGKIKNLYEGPGVRSLASTAFFASAMDAEKVALFSAMFKKLQGNGVLQEPYLGALSDTRGIVVTWTLNGLGAMSTDVAVITLFRYTTAAAVNLEFPRRAQAIVGYTPLQPTFGYSDDGPGSFLIFTHAPKNILVTLESPTLKYATLKNVAKDVQAVLTDLTDPPTPTSATPAAVTFQPECVVGQTFEYTIEAAVSNTGAWRGYRVDLSNENVLLTDASIDTQQNVTFTLLARKPGLTNIFVTLFDTSLRQWPDEAPFRSCFLVKRV